MMDGPPGDMIERGKLFVGGLSWKTTKDSMETYFSRYGEVSDCVVMVNADNKPRGFGFVTFKEHSSVEAVLQDANHILDDKHIDPKYATVKGKPTQKFKLFVGGLSPNTTAESLLAAVNSQYPNKRALTAEIKMDPEGKSKGFGFMEVDSEETLQQLVRLKFYTVDGKNVEMKKANPQEKTIGQATQTVQSVNNQGYDQSTMFQQPPGYYQYDRSTSGYVYNHYPNQHYGSYNQSSHAPVYSSYPNYSGRGYSGQQQQMSGYSTDTSYNQTSDTPYSSGGMMNYSNYGHGQQQGYYAGEQTGGGGSPSSSYTRSGGMSTQARGIPTSHGFPYNNH